MDFQEISQALHQHKNPEQAPKMQAYMRNLFPFLGVPKPLRAQVCKPFFKASKNQPVHWDFIEACWGVQEREFQYVAVDYLRLKKAQLTPEELPLLQRLVVEKSWWDTVDNLALPLGEIIFRYAETTPEILAWSVHKNMWLRRIAIIHQLLRKEKTSQPLLEEILVNNLGQKEFFINKAIGWALRDYSKTNPEWVSHFLRKYGQRMATLSVREASKYL